MNTSGNQTIEDVITGLYLLVYVLETAAIPGPRKVTHCIIADNDADGKARIDRIGYKLERAGIEHHIDDTDHHRKVIIPLTKQFTYEIFYVYRASMDAYDRRQSYCKKIT